MAGLRWTLARALAALHVLPAVDRVRGALAARRSAADNAAFLAARPGLVPPPAELAYDAWHHVDWAVWDRSGAVHARVFVDALLRHADAPPRTLLEWGCGCGRITRHLHAALGAGNARVRACDADPRAVAWCRANLPGVEVLAHGRRPPLPLPDGAADAVIGFSVLTHISEDSAHAWIAELRRVLRPGGLLLLTTHGEGQTALLSRAERRRFEAGRIVVQPWAPEGRKWYLAYHPPGAMRERLLAGMQVLEHVPGRRDGAFPQDLWIARRGPTTAAR